MLRRDPILADAERAFLETARRAVLVTIALDGRARPVPICFALDAQRPLLYTPIDEKPKAVDDPSRLARVRDVERDPRVAVLVDRWDEDWNGLAWLRAQGRAALLRPEDGAAEHAVAITELCAKYPQYASHDLESRPVIRIAIERATSWGNVGGAD